MGKSLFCAPSKGAFHDRDEKYETTFEFQNCFMNVVSEFRWPSFFSRYFLVKNMGKVNVEPLYKALIFAHKSTLKNKKFSEILIPHS